MKRFAITALCCAAASCSQQPQEGGLDVTVELKGALLSHCVQVAVKQPKGAELRTGGIVIDGKMKIVVGVAQGTLPSAVKVYAEGFADAHCTMLTQPAERTIDADATFESGAVGELTLTLEASAGKETDCADGLDSDQDGRIDCLDSDCDNRPCLGGGDCMGGVCKGAATERNLCDDGVDNDQDGATDCDDSDCVGAICTASDKCLTGATCTAAKTCTGGTTKTCTMPLACQVSPGTCDAATGLCVYAFADAGSTCEDGNACTLQNHCDGAGSCVMGAAQTCNSPPGPCFSANGGACDTVHGCPYTVNMGATCDDGQSCTSPDSCAADGGCSGPRTACVATGCQTFTGQCGADAGCLFAESDAGAACDGGVCNAGGACIPLFPYVPSNFTESQLPTPASTAVLLNCGVTTIDTGVSGPPTFTGWCPSQPLPGTATISQSDGPDVVLLSFSKLTLAAGATLRVRGARPAIIAATSDVTIAGLVDVSAGPFDCADGGFGAPGASGDTNGGGGGGSFATIGGIGGDGSGNLGTNGGGGRPGVTETTNLTLTPLRGGCRGGLGAGSPATAASGGGALQISSATAVLVSGTITAPGQGGPGARNGTGGNGAGSGGAILLEALQLTISAPATLTANGGGGGQGGGPLTSGTEGDPGTADAGPASGGDGFSTGGPGGHGAALSSTAGGGANGTFGSGNGGGGGGGLGRIHVRASVQCSLGLGVVASPQINTDGGC